MIVYFWGTRGSLPGSFTTADIRVHFKHLLSEAFGVENGFEKSGKTLDAYVDEFISSKASTCGVNTSCVEIETGTENEYILLDAGTGIRDFALSHTKKGNLAKPSCFHLFITHLHWDHIQGFPFFVPIYVPGNKIIIHGYHHNIEENFKKQMNPPCFPVPLDAVSANIVFDIKFPWESFDVCGFKVRAIQQNHPGMSFGYRFEKNGKSVVYSTDCEHTENAHDDSYPFTEFFKNADLLIFDAMYSLADASITKLNWGHSNNFMGIKLSAKSKVKNFALFHHEPIRSDAELEKFLMDTITYRDFYHKERNTPPNETFPKNVILAKDGLTIDV